MTVALTLMLTLVACGDGSGESTRSTTNPGSSTQLAEPVPGGSLTVAVDAESDGLDPHRSVWANAGHIIGRTIFDTLAALDRSGMPQPNLAESITPNADATVWTIAVRPDVRFHNGEPLDANAVKRNFDAALASPIASTGVIDHVDVVDDRTVVVTMSAPWSTFPNSLAGGLGNQLGYVAAPAMLDDPDGMRHPIGTGPFVFSDWVRDDHLTVVRNDHYWRPPAHLDEVVFRPIVQTHSTFAAFDAEEVDVIYTAAAEQVRLLLEREAAGGGHVIVAAPSDPDLIALNTTRAPLDDVRVRRALAMGVDVDRMIELREADGVAHPMRGPYDTSSYWYVPNGYPSFDPEAARALIDEYEAVHGPVELDLAGVQSVELLAFLELIQAMWADIGAEVDIVTRSQSELIAAVVARDYDAVGWNGVGSSDPDLDYDDFHSGAPAHITGYADAEIDAAMEAGRRLTDPAARKQQYAIVQRALGEAVPYVWLSSNQWAVAGRPGVEGLDAVVLPDGSAGQSLVGPSFSLLGVWLTDPP